MIQRMEEAARPVATVVMTGATPPSSRNTASGEILIDENLLLDGLYYLYQKNLTAGGSGGNKGCGLSHEGSGKKRPRCVAAVVSAAMERRRFMERFQKIYSQGIVSVMEIWVDTETGVHYLFHRDETGRGLHRCWIGKENLW